MADKNDSMPEVNIRGSFDAIKKTTKSGIDFWYARELQEILGYAKWESFEDAIERARQACESAGIEPRNHFADVKKKVSIGSGAEREIRDIALTRYAAYLTAMNGDPTKQEIATAQVYFTVQARKQEVADALGQTDARIELRERIREDIKALNSAAKQAGVQNFGLFHDAGYRGLYGGIGLTEIKDRKGLKPNEDLMDRASRAELAANDFRITQAEEKLRRDNIQGEITARQTHREVGKEVRDTISKLGGDMPEDLEPAPSIKKLASSKKRKELPPSS